MGNARDAAEERRIRRKGENAKVRAPRRRQSSWRRRKRRPWESIWGCSVTHEALVNRSQGKPVQCPGALGLDIPFSLLCTAQIREEHAYSGFQRVFFTCLMPVGWGFSWHIVQKVRTDRTFRGPGCRCGLGGKLHHIFMVRANIFSEFLKLPSRQCSASQVLEYLVRFHSLPPK